MDFEKANEQLSRARPEKIIEWAISNSAKPIVTTNFGPFEAVILHMATLLKADIPVIWVDSGYNTRNTYKVAQQMIETLNLNIHVYTPRVSAARQDASLGGIPNVNEERHAEFTEQFKLEPFVRAMAEHQPDVWLTAVRSEQTAFRQELKVFNEGPGGVVKVAPILHWKEPDMLQYLGQHNLPNVEKYFDPTKAEANRECGLHTEL